MALFSRSEIANCFTWKSINQPSRPSLCLSVSLSLFSSTSLTQKSANCFEVRGKTLGIIGYGHVGAQLGIIAEFFGMKVVWYDHQPLMPIGNSVPLDSMADVLKQADFLSIHISEIEENANLIKKEQLALMKKGSFLLNASYGKAVDLDALTEALKSGHLFGAALDAFPPDLNHDDPSFLKSLKAQPNVILTPRLGGLSLST